MYILVGPELPKKGLEALGVSDPGGEAVFVVFGGLISVVELKGESDAGADMICGGGGEGVQNGMGGVGDVCVWGEECTVSLIV